MIRSYVGEPPSRPIVEADHRSILALLPEYVALCILAQQRPPEWLAMERHLGQCTACRGEADALLALMETGYSDASTSIPAPAPPDLAFLARPLPTPAAPRKDTPHKPARKPHFQPIVIQFSGSLLPNIRVQVAARAGGIHLRYAYEIPPTDDTSPTITVEVLVHDDQPTVGLVRVCVEHPDRSPFDQAGSHVILQAGDMRQSGVTDQNGVTAFHDIPLAQMDHWQITVAAGETDDPT
jgi:hypothetical protein